MDARGSLTRDDAARLLGVPIDATPDEVRRAWRMWARVAHPDAGGDSAHFAALDRARSVLLSPSPLPNPTPGHPSSDEFDPAPPRVRLSDAVRRPRHPYCLAIGAAAAILLALVPATLAIPADTVDFAMAATPAAVAAAVWALWATTAILLPTADRGHRIAVVALAWIVVALAQQSAAALAGVSLMTVLPLLALPLAAVVGAINVGAGLWRPIHAPRR